MSAAIFLLLFGERRRDPPDRCIEVAVIARCRDLAPMIRDVAVSPFARANESVFDREDIQVVAGVRDTIVTLDADLNVIVSDLELHEISFDEETDEVLVAMRAIEVSVSPRAISVVAIRRLSEVAPSRIGVHYD